MPKLQLLPQLVMSAMSMWVVVMKLFLVVVVLAGSLLVDWLHVRQVLYKL